ncbi:hypothetical protein ABRP70_12330 [Pectobacterium odoriferum]|uniref:hypothetical protein n=1 Tax=Pectobacterium TaxID=122277 RepID=UPI00196999AF|nr:hypothetical protein [Pectobacterium versatile]MBN3059738.1 hypothetical protein [Pectobacterium versatile]MCA5931413.1 hypothetical protein [Pectobacterium versatile]MCA5948648.1 hypothetical protein [Pectobacterium versatile]MCA5952919.1 hypothetical protein [Pectobacterium versatile]UCP87864.1 hypothetical protein LGL96_09860 [Pectobacterium versatile]
MKIKNLNHTTGKTCSCGSWLKHWENITCQKSSYCGNGGCTNNAEVGAHVKKSGNNDNAHYIVPLCKECNKKSSTEEFLLWEMYELVSAGSASCIKEDFVL